MDELITIAIWFWVIILSINGGIIFLASPANSEMAAWGLTPAISGMQQYDVTQYASIDFNSGNTISSSEPTLTATGTNNFVYWFYQMIDLFIKLIGAWALLLYGLLSPIPGGLFFIAIILPLIGIIQIISFYVLAKEFAAIIRGVIRGII